jgi:hypothetical protein
VTAVITGVVTCWSGIVCTIFFVGTDVSTQKISQRLISGVGVVGDIGVIGLVVSVIVCIVDTIK